MLTLSQFKRLCTLLSILFLGGYPMVHAQEIIPLYPGAVPGSKASKMTETGADKGLIRGVTKPTLEVYLPEKDKASGTAVVIIPGGGYGVVVYQGEGVNTAKELAKRGVAAFVLKYRLPNDTIRQENRTATGCAASHQACTGECRKMGR